MRSENSTGEQFMGTLPVTLSLYIAMLTARSNCAQPQGHENVALPVVYIYFDSFDR